MSIPSRQQLLNDNVCYHCSIVSLTYLVDCEIAEGHPEWVTELRG